MNKQCLIKKIASIITAAVLLCLISLPVLAESIGGGHVLILNSYHRGYKWSDDIVKGVESVLKAKDIKIYVEYMDTKRLSDDAYFQGIFEIYKRKYQQQHFEVIIATDNDAYNFMRKHRDQLFPDVPVVFCGVNFFDPADIKGIKLFTGVNEEADLHASIDIALKLHPDAKVFYIINDQTTTGKRVHEILADVIAHHPRSREIRFISLENEGMNEILKVLSGISPHSLVFYSFYFRDPGGKFYDNEEAISLISKSTNAPVYGCWDFNLGFGIVGGMLTSGFYQGEEAGKMALRIMNGENVDNIPIITKSPNRYMFDYNQMKRFGVNISNLPSGSIVINKPEGFSEFYDKNRFFVQGMIFTCLILIVSVLLFTLIKLRKASSIIKLSEERYRAIFDNTGTAMAIIEQDAIISLVNPEFEKLSGFSKGEIEGKKSWKEFAIADELKMIEEIYYRRRIEKESMQKSYEFKFVNRDGSIRDIYMTGDIIPGTSQKVASLLDITERKIAEKEREELINELTDAVSKVKTLSGFLPICSSCKKIRNDGGYWQQVEHYIRDHSDAELSHSLCPECAVKLYPNLAFNKKQ